MYDMLRVRAIRLQMVAWSIGAVLSTPAGFASEPLTDAAPAAGSPTSTDKAPLAPLDRTGRKRVGKASFYAKRFAGKKMADGQLMQPHGDNAASKTLPLGTTAKVTNLETGKSAVVTIKDRGPYVKGRIVDLSPGTAERIGIDADNGVAKVAVTPIAVPLADGSVKPGAAAKDPSTPDTAGTAAANKKSHPPKP